MTVMVAEKELYRACEVIFGPELDISRDFLEYIQLSGVKAAYRKRALETHPDRFAAADHAAAEGQSGAVFHDVQQAYESLRQYLEARDRGFKLPGRRPVPPGSGNTARQPRRNTGRGTGCNAGQGAATGFKAGRDTTGTPRCFKNIDQLHQGPLPNRRLELGQFLYYSGLASWRTIVKALAWQRGRRPRIGEISRRFGLLSEQDVARVLRHQQPGQRFGEAAQAMGLLTEPQVRLLLQTQKRLQHKFGEYFLKEKILTPGKLARLLTALHRHNNRMHRKFNGRKTTF